MPERMYNTGIPGAEDQSSDEEPKLGELTPEQKKHFKRLRVIAQRVGGDFGMDVEIGEPGKGSFFDSEDISIQIDPLHLKESPETAKFVVAHEGGHRAITRSPKKLGLPEEKIKELYSQIGFGFLQNAVEDPADNDWVQEKFPGLAEHFQNNYDEQLASDEAVLAGPPIRKMAKQLGYWPKFAKFGSEIIRRWHTGSFSPELDKDVRQALEGVIDDIDESISAIPPTENPKESEVIDEARKRFQINTEKIWPKMKKLVEKDLGSGEKRQKAQDIYEKLKKLKEKMKQSGQGAGSQPDGSPQSPQKQESGKPNNAEDENDSKSQQGVEEPENGQPSSGGNASEENAEGSEGGSGGAGEDLEDEIDELKDDLESSGLSDEQLKELEDAIDQAKEDTAQSQSGPASEGNQDQQGEASGGGDGETAENQDESNSGQGGSSSGSGTGDVDLSPGAGQSESSDIDGPPVPLDELSEDLKDSLREAVENMNPEEREKLKEKSKENIENFDERLYKETKSKLEEDSVDVSEVRDKIEEKEEQEAERKKREQEREERKRERQERLEKLQEKSRAEMTEFEKTRAEVSGEIDMLYHRLRDILHPDNQKNEESGKPSGRRVEMRRAMQAEQDPNQRNKMWVRRKEPEQRDYRFWHLVDMSGSMEGKPIKETYKGFVIAAKAVDRLEDLNTQKASIRQGISGFNNGYFDFKEYDDRFNKDLEKELSAMKNKCGGGTDTTQGTQEALEQMEEDIGSAGNFLFTFTDGQPNNRQSLAETLEKTKQKRREENIKAGLIWIGAEDVDVEKLVEEYGYDFGMKIPANAEEESFSKKLANLLEDVLRNPQHYE